MPGWNFITSVWRQRQTESLGLPIEGFDAQIAAICRTHGAVLGTRNVKES